MSSFVPQTWTYQTGNVSFCNKLQLSILKQSVNTKENVIFVLGKKISGPNTNPYNQIQPFSGSLADLLEGPTAIFFWWFWELNGH